MSPGTNFRDAGWSANSYLENAAVMTWALFANVNGALNLRITALDQYTRDTVSEQMRKYIANDITVSELSLQVSKS